MSLQHTQPEMIDFFFKMASACHALTHSLNKYVKRIEQPNYCHQWHNRGLNFAATELHSTNSKTLPLPIRCEYEQVKLKL